MYLDSLAVNPNNSSANLGAAAAQTYLYMVDLNKEIKNFVNYVKTGDFRNGFQFLVLNNTAVTDSISRFYNAACSDRQLGVYSAGDNEYSGPALYHEFVH